MMITVSKKLLFFIFLLNFSTVLAQQTSSDTLRTFNLKIPPEIIEYQFNELDFIGDFNKIPFYSTFIDDTTSLWIKTRLQLSSFNNQTSSTNNFQSNLLNPLYDQYLKSQSLKTLKYILGSVQVGAVGYLVYKHLKKYGFLKKK